MVQYSPEKRAAIVALRGARFSLREIVRLQAVSSSCVHKTLQRYQETGRRHADCAHGENRAELKPMEACNHKSRVISARRDFLRARFCPARAPFRAISSVRAVGVARFCPARARSFAIFVVRGCDSARTSPGATATDREQGLHGRPRREKIASSSRLLSATDSFPLETFEQTSCSLDQKLSR